jgi:hypothetical protein
LGDEQPENPAPSRLHWNVPSSLELNSKVALVLLTTPDGPPPKDVSGAILSTVQPQELTVETLPLVSTARTSNVYSPLAAGFSLRPLVQVVQSCTLTTRHSKRLNVGSAAIEKLNVVAPFTGPLGPESEGIAGAVTSSKTARVCRSDGVRNLQVVPVYVVVVAAGLERSQMMPARVVPSLSHLTNRYPDLGVAT